MVNRDEDVRRQREALIASAVCPLILLALWLCEAPLGKPGKFVYVYSPIVSLRLEAAPGGMLVAIILALAVYWIGAERRAARMLGRAALCCGFLGLGVWSFRAPPAYVNQHFFNMRSPSQDGAFVVEAEEMERVGVRAYCRAFPSRAATPEELMRGTRVISNPPGATLVSLAAREICARAPSLKSLLDRWVDDPGLTPAEREMVSIALLTALIWQALWIVSAIPLWLLGRIFLAPAGAAAFAICAMVTPATLMFAPGKDAAQLLTATTPVWLWFLAEKRRSVALGVGSGFLFGLSCLVSLAHAWIAAAVAIASLLGARGVERRRVLSRILQAAAGGLLGAVFLWVVLDYDLFASSLAVARAQAGVTRGPGSMPLAWQSLGVPLFLLFAGAGLWTLACWRGARSTPGERGVGPLTLVTGVILILTVGFTNVETPRLWIPFAPLLLLGLAAGCGPFRDRRPRDAGLLALLMLLQLSAATVQWSLMDAREAETRLMGDGAAPPRMFH